MHGSMNMECGELTDALPPNYTASQPRREYFSRIIHQHQLQNSLRDRKVLVFHWIK